MYEFNFSRSLKKTATWIICLWLLFFLSSTVLADAAPAAAEGIGTNASGLWQKALAVYQKNNDLIPGKMEVVSEMLDRRGRSDSVSKLYFNIIVDDQGKAHSELIRAFKDNRDVSAEMRKKLEIRDA